MRFQFKTRYEQDIDLFRDNVDRFWYGALAIALLAAPLLLHEFWIGELSYVFILAIAGVGLMILTGYTGLVSLGHAAFLGIGAYTHAVLLKMGLPLVVTVPAATLLTAIFGAMIGFPALRLTGVYLAIATLAFAFIVEQALSRWDSVTGGFAGFAVPKPEIFGITLTDTVPFYFVSLAFLVFAIWATLNVLRSPVGRAFVAIRDSEIAAQSMGVNLAAYKTLAFAMSAGLTGLAGTLFAHKISFLAPDAFNILLSIQLLLMVVVGGSIDPRRDLRRDFCRRVAAVDRDPARLSARHDRSPTRARAGIFGTILVLFILFEPLGFYGRWRKIKLYFSLFPLYKRATFKRQKSYTKSERFR